MRRRHKKFLGRVAVLATLFFWALVLVLLPGLMMSMIALEGR